MKNPLKQLFMLILKKFEICRLKINMSKTIAIKLGDNATFFNKAEGKDLRWQHKGKSKEIS
jgi:hypothetical protein